MVEQKKLKVAGISIVFVWTIFVALFPVIGSASQSTGIKSVDPIHGPAKIKGEDVSYYYYGIKLAADVESSVIFKQGTCLLLDQKGTKYPKCWIHIAGASAGLSVGKQAPVSMKTLALELEGSRASNVVQWNTSMVDGPDGSLEFTIPKGGYVVLNFLWEVPRGFLPGRIKIGDLVDVSLKK